jgi:mannose-6-phosphate isomerase-like protein (cupin superfamily)
MANCTTHEIVHNRHMSWESAHVKPKYDLLAPDGSEIRLLVSLPRASMVHCTLQPGHVTRATLHRSVEEVWFCLAGAGQVWRRSAYSEEVVDLAPGVALSIPLGVSFQFRASGAQPLELVITTIPPWPGEDEAIFVDGPWESTT